VDRLVYIAIKESRATIVEAEDVGVGIDVLSGSRYCKESRETVAACVHFDFVDIPGANTKTMWSIA